jgi:thioester reductase-like protein
MASGGKEASLAATGNVTGSNFIARIASTVIATGSADSVEQSSKIESRQVKQMTAGTARGISTNIVARTAVANNIARTAIADNITRTAIGGATTVQTKSVEQVSERITKCELRSAVNDSARIAVGNNVARTTVGNDIAWGVCLRRGKQVTQTSAQTEAGCVASDFTARIAIGNDIAWVAGDHCVARIAVSSSGAESVDQSLEPGEQVALYSTPVTGSTRVNTRRVARTHRKALSPHH